MQHNQSVEQSAKLHAAQVRARLFDKPRPKPVLAIAPPAPVPEPEHVVNKRRFVSDFPGWMLRPTVFNAHVVSFRRHLVELEYEMAGLDVPCQMTMNEIAEMVLKDYPGISVEEIKGSRRTHNLTLPRHIICYTIRKLRPDVSMPMIARWCGNRDHTTILNSVWKIQKMVDDGKFRVVEVAA